jgi:outer membrane receptor protein involved in Fe transport
MPAHRLRTPNIAPLLGVTLTLSCLGTFQVSAAQDSTRTVSLASKDTVQFFVSIRDSVARVRPIPLVGALEPFRDSSEFIVGSDIPWIEYRYIGDVLWTKPGMYIRDMGSPGQNNQLTIGGIDWRGIAFLVDGRSQNDPISGSYDMILFPTDYVERIEFITGPRAMVYGMNSTGGAINVITKSYYTNKPYSRLRYSQGADEYAQTDALFSQNIFPRFNFMFGLTRHTIGSHRLDQEYRARYPNADHDAWSFRTKARYNISNSFNIVFSHLFHQTRTGLNGGVDYLQTPDEVFDGLRAAVTNSDAYEKISNHHLDLTAAAYLGGDSTQVTTLTTYYSNQLREYRDEERPFQTSTNGIFLQSDHRSSNTGVLLRHVWEGSAHNFNATVQAEEFQIESSPEVGGHRENKLSASVKEEVRLFSPFTFAAFGRMDRYRAKSLTGFGADAQMSLGSSLILFGGISRSERTPTLQELYWSSDSTHLPTPRLGLLDEKHTLFEAGMRFSLSDFLAGSISFTHRVIKNPILIDTVVDSGIEPLRSSLQFSQPASRTFDGVNISVHASYERFFVEGNATYLKQPTSFHGNQKLVLLPDLYLDGSVYFRNELFDGSLELKVGFRGRFISKQTGMAPLSESGLYVPYLLLRSFGPSGTADFFLIGRLGNAYLHFIWENLSGNQYMLTPVYPMYDRNIRFGISWEFWN